MIGLVEAAVVKSSKKERRARWQAREGRRREGLNHNVGRDSVKLAVVWPLERVWASKGRKESEGEGEGEGWGCER